MLEKFEDYSTIERLIGEPQLPRIFSVRQHFQEHEISDIAQEVLFQLNASGVLSTIRPGMSIAVTAGSRGIHQIPVILREVVRFLKCAGANPFLVPAMGSHGGATAEGQRKILTGFGITEEFCGCPIVSSMETVCLGTVRDDEEDVPVYIDSAAARADGIVVVNRVKAHTGFRASVESGLTKMMTVGLGKQKGASYLHKAGFATFATRLPLIGNYIRTHTNVLFGVAIIENAYERTDRIVVLHSDEIPEKEPKLLEYAKSLMPQLPVAETDVLVVCEIGKNISGSGMDPNITGTFDSPYASGGILSQIVCVLDIATASHGCGNGIGGANITTKRVYEKMDFLKSYTNSITSTCTTACRLPMVMRDDKMAISLAVRSCNGVDPGTHKMVFLKNTLSIEEVYLSEAFYSEMQNTPGIEITSPCVPIPFDEHGTLKLWES